MQSDIPVTVEHKGGGFGVVQNSIRKIYGKELGLAGLGLYTVLAGYAGGNQYCWPSLDTIAKDVGCDRRTIDAHIDNLVKLGLLTITRRPGKSSLYTLNEIPPSKNEEGTKNEGTPPSKNEGTTPLKNCTPKNNSKEEQRRITTDELALSLKDSRYTDEFEKSYFPYPMKSGKEDAQKHFKKLSTTDKLLLVRAIGHYAAFMQKYPAELEYAVNAGRFYYGMWRDWVNGPPQGMREKAEAKKRRNGGPALSVANTGPRSPLTL